MNFSVRCISNNYNKSIMNNMENSNNSKLGPVWLNSELFVINGAPFKFHLLGYNESDSRSMTQIIQAFGGTSSEPDSPDTFVFCERGCPFDPEEHDLYDIRYFYDSIVALQPQELRNYKIDSDSNEQIWSVVDENESVYLDSKEEVNNNSEGSSNYKLVVTVDRVFPNPVDDDKSVSQADCRENTCFVMVRRLNEDRVEVKSDEQEMNDEIDHDYEEIEKYRSKSCPDDSDYTLVKSNDLSGASVRRRTSTLKERLRSYRSRKVTFTEKENRKILEWIMKKEVIPTDFETIIWEDMIRAKVVKDRTVLPSIYAKHFREKLKHYEIFKKYIEDSRAS